MRHAPPRGTPDAPTVPTSPAPVAPAARTDPAAPSLRPAALVGHPEFIAALLDSLADGIVACDADGTLQLFNRATQAWHGLPAEPLPQEHLADHYDLYEADGTTPLTTERIPLLRALRGEVVVEQPMVIAPRDGPERRVRATGQRITDPAGRVLGAVVAMHDHTARLDAVEQLAAERAELDAARRDRQRLEQLRALQQATGGLLAADSLAGAQQRLVDAACEVLGAHGAELAWEAHGEHRRRLAVGCGEGAALRTDVPAGPDEQDLVAATLTVWRTAPWSEDDALLLAQLGTVAAQATRLLRLHHRFAVSESRQLRDELLAAVSHQMQTPLATIVGLSQTLARDELPPGGRRDVHAALERQARMLRYLVLGFLDHARLAAGQELTLRAADVDVAATTADVCSLFAPLGRVGAPTGLGPGDVVLRGDAVRLEQVLVTLLDNAHQHGAGAIEVAVARTRDRVSVTVRDHGPGVGPEPERLFHARAQGRSLELDVTGSGIGLHLARRIAELRGGRLAAHDHEEGGAVLELVLPLDRS